MSNASLSSGAKELETIARKHGALTIEWDTASSVAITFPHSHDRARAIREMQRHAWYDNRAIDQNNLHFVWVFLAE